MRPKVLLIAMAVLYGLVGAVLGTLVIVSDRNDALLAAEAGTRDFAHLLEEHTRHSLDVADLTLLRLGDRVAAGRGAAFADVLAGASEITDLIVLGRDGRVVADARGGLPPGTDLSSRDWVAAIRKAPTGIGIIGGAVADPASGAILFTVAHRFDNGDIGAAILDIEPFRHVHQPLDIGPDASLGIETLDGAVLVRHPAAADGIRAAMEAGVTHATIRIPSAAGGGTRIVTYRVLADRNLLVWGGISQDEALAQWRSRSARGILVMLGALALMAGLAILLMREWARERVATRDLEALNRELGRSNADLEQFAYVASHDLKEPLRNISSYVQLLQRRYHGKLDADADAFIGYTVEGVRRMQTIIQELLAYSRIGTGTLAMQPVPAGIAVATALGQLKTVIGEAQAAVEVKGPLPVVMADPTQLASLFQNLIGNGLKYRRPEVRPEVTVGVEDRGREWAFFVRDNGIGIDSQYHHQIFELFKRLHPRAHYQGTGIGLSVCKRVVERHHGHIWVESRPGQGSTFWFALPKLKE